MRRILSGLEIRSDQFHVTDFVTSDYYVVGRRSARWFGIRIPYRLALWFQRRWR